MPSIFLSAKLWFALLIVGLIATIAFLSLRLDVKAAELKASGVALTSFEAALRSTKEQVSELEATRAIDSAVLSNLQAMYQRNQRKSRTYQDAQEALEKSDVKARDFLSCPTGDKLRELLDAEDGIDPKPS